MNVKEKFKATGKLRIIHTKADGTVTESFYKNLVVNAGLDHIAGRLVDTGTDATHTIPAEMSHMAIGTGSTAAAAGDTQLGAQVARVTFDTVQVTEPSVEYTATFAPGVGTAILREAGIFNASSGGTMLCRTVFPTVTKEAGDQIVISWVVTIAATP
jgi:hypothetical protein